MVKILDAGMDFCLHKLYVPSDELGKVTSLIYSNDVQKQIGCILLNFLKNHSNVNRVP
jgi:hypothetical protein